MKDSITQSITQSVGEIIQKEMTKYNKPDVNQSHRQNQQYNKDNRTKAGTTRCFNYNEEDHYIKDCKKPRKIKSSTENRVRAETVGQVSAPETNIEIKDITTRNGPSEDELDVLNHDLSSNVLFEEFVELQKSTPRDVSGIAKPLQAIEKNIVIDLVRAATITVH
ncbi:unnamed protein product [Mytilus coruscus]|uniref:CCHC-type domain-containing protein n=1 Tax=Mytilus coruscus TaxID=42192 RepID=A0A6J8CSC8_MYTCO|nr:unnamed protein product [Mytilus coruscus]